MPELDVQLRTLVERAATPVTFEEVAVPVLPRRGHSNGLRMLVAATSVVVLAVAILAVGRFGGDGHRSTRVQPRGSGEEYVDIPSASMEPTLHAGDRVLVDTHTYDKQTPARGDVVLLPARVANLTDPNSPLAKRVIGMPGETIEGRDGLIYIDGVVLNEASYLSSTVKSKTFGPIVDPPDTYFVLGDNREYSNDSTVFGPVARSDLWWRGAGPDLRR